MLDLTEQIFAIGVQKCCGETETRTRSNRNYLHCHYVLVSTHFWTYTVALPQFLCPSLSPSLHPGPPASLPSSPHRGPGSQFLSTEKNGLFLHSCQTSAAAWRNKARGTLFQRDGANRPKVFVAVGLKRPPDKLSRAHICLNTSQMLRYHFVIYRESDTSSADESTTSVQSKGPRGR